MKPKKPEYTPMSHPPQPKEHKDIEAEEGAKFEREIVKFMSSLKRKKLDRNKPIREIDAENQQFSNLIEAARRVELVSTAKGTMGLSITAMRMLLFLNNKVNEMASDFEKLQKDILSRLPEAKEDDEKAQD